MGTSAMYHKVLDECLTRIHGLKMSGEDPQRIGIMVASHNEDTVRYGVGRMAELDLDPQSGYSVYKYVPYGPVNEVLPYLSRRARENGGMMTKLATEKSLQRKELFRRLRTGQVFYKPQGNYVPVGFERDSKLLNTK